MLTVPSQTSLSAECAYGTTALFCMCAVRFEHALHRHMPSICKSPGVAQTAALMTQAMLAYARQIRAELKKTHSPSSRTHLDIVVNLTDQAEVKDGQAAVGGANEVARIYVTMREGVWKSSMEAGFEQAVEEAKQAMEGKALLL